MGCKVQQHVLTFLHLQIANQIAAKLSGKIKKRKRRVSLSISLTTKHRTKSVKACLPINNKGFFVA
jgi:hypothetical protein